MKLSTFFMICLFPFQLYAFERKMNVKAESFFHFALSSTELIEDPLSQGMTYLHIASCIEEKDLNWASKIVENIKELTSKQNDSKIKTLLESAYYAFKHDKTKKLSQDTKRKIIKALDILVVSRQESMEELTLLSFLIEKLINNGNIDLALKYANKSQVRMIKIFNLIKIADKVLEESPEKAYEILEPVKNNRIVQFSLYAIRLKEIVNIEDEDKKNIKLLKFVEKIKRNDLSPDNNLSPDIEYSYLAATGALLFESNNELARRLIHRAIHIAKRLPDPGGRLGGIARSLVERDQDWARKLFDQALTKAKSQNNPIRIINSKLIIAKNLRFLDYDKAEDLVYEVADFLKKPLIQNLWPKKLLATYYIEIATFFLFSNEEIKEKESNSINSINSNVGN